MAHTEHELRWVEQRIRERECIDAERNAGTPGLQRKHPDWRKTGRYDVTAYLAWKLTEESSLQKAGDRLFATDGTPEGRKAKAHRRWKQVELELGRDHDEGKRKTKRKARALDFKIAGDGQIVALPER